MLASSVDVVLRNARKCDLATLSGWIIGDDHGLDTMVEADGA
ncbi:hypothetical protein V474_20835 [Novosphingobium barchaimii LL02]|uniref:Uncharacterized protein n=1 Tax=Novosphingobium barchaimii LL02 TaxID=1114963 RepID=A0A0J8AI00_9SPHN|nr:hypothetical protein V474_12640 [Novosphingobium barchaimii LL02]KMS54425.1 hypothetical protein V474_20835 [Novosphingobium barchaimii LL02]